MRGYLILFLFILSLSLYRSLYCQMSMSNVERLLNFGPKNLMTTYSIVAALNADLKGKRFDVPGSLAAKLGGKSFRSKLSLPSPTASTSADSADKIPAIAQKPRKPSLKQLKAKPEKWSETELAKGFIDENGQEVWIVQDVLAYSATKGYKVKWLGWADTTWNRPEDMPRNDVWLNARMAKARHMHFCRK